MGRGNRILLMEERRPPSDGLGAETASITAAKQLKLTRAARHYLAEYEGDFPCRFDAVLISGEQENDIEWIQNAFDES